MMPGADEANLRLITGQTVDARAPWPFQPLTALQQRERLQQERALQEDRLRGLPTVFGDL